MEQNGGDGGDSAPTSVGEQLHAHCSACRDVSSTTLHEREEARTDDSDERRSVGITGWKSELEDYALDAGFLHVRHQGNVLALLLERSERMELDDPLIDVVAFLRIDVPSKFVQWCVLLYLEQFTQVRLETLGCSDIGVVRLWESW